MTFKAFITTDASFTSDAQKCFAAADETAD